MNNNLTKDMLRLRNEILRSRSENVTLRGRRSALLKVIRQETAQLLASFTKARAGISQQTKTMLTESVTGLRQSVLDLRRGFQVHLVGARQDWHGVGTKPRRKL